MAGAMIRLRYSDRDPGQVTGYSVALPGNLTRAGNPIWCSGGKLAPDLTLPKLRCRWERPRNDPRSAPQPGLRMSPRSARAFLRSAACSAAQRARNESEYFTELTAMGVQIRYRYSDQQPGEITGYALSITGQGVDQVWCAGGQLGANLTLPRLRRCWAIPENTIRPPVTPAEHRAIWDDVITATSQAAERMRTSIRTDPAAAADSAWATADLLRATARVIRGPAGQDLRRAASEFDRAAREARVVVPRPSPPGDTLRAAAQFLSLTRPGPAARKLRILVAILADLTEVAAELRQIQQRHHQAAAARTAHGCLTQLGERISAHGDEAARHLDAPVHRAAEVARTDLPPYHPQTGPRWQPAGAVRAKRRPQGPLRRRRER